MIIYTYVIELCMKAILIISAICLNAKSNYVFCKRARTHTRTHTHAHTHAHANAHAHTCTHAHTHTHKYFTILKAVKAQKGCRKIALLFR